jgi:hypothetical protein
MAMNVVNSLRLRSRSHYIRSRDVDTYDMAGPQVQGRSASCGKTYARGCYAGLNPKRSDPAEK